MKIMQHSRSQWESSPVEPLDAGNELRMNWEGDLKRFVFLVCFSNERLFNIYDTYLELFLRPNSARLVDTIGE